MEKLVFNTEFVFTMIWLDQSRILFDVNEATIEIKHVDGANLVTDVEKVAMYRKSKGFYTYKLTPTTENYSTGVTYLVTYKSKHPTLNTEDIIDDMFIVTQATTSDPVQPPPPIPPPVIPADSSGLSTSTVR